MLMSLFRRLANRGNDIGALVRKAEALRDAHESAAAADAYLVALSRAPDRVDLQVQCGNMLKDSGRWVEAEFMYRKALAARPNEADIHLQLGHLLKRKGIIEGAKSAYRAALAIDPAAGSARIELLNLGDIDLDAETSRPARYATTMAETSALSLRLAALEAEIVILRKALPDYLAVRAFPVDHWADLRRLFTVPAPPGAIAIDTSFHVILDGSDNDEAELHARLSSLCSQRLISFTASIIATGPVAEAVARYTQADPCLTVANSLGEAIATGRTPFVVLSSGSDRFDGHALAWFDYAFRVSGAHGVTSDSETLKRSARSDEPAKIVLRSPADPDSLLEADLIGSTLAVKSEVLRQELEAGNSLTAAEAIRSIGLRLSSTFGIAHVPLPLVATIKPSPLPPPCYKVLVRRHLNLGGNDGVALEECRGADATAITQAIWPCQPHLQTVSVIIPTLLGGSDVVNIVTSLRQHAAQPISLEIIIIDNGCTSEAKVPLDDLAKAGHVQIFDAPGPFNWAHLNNRAVAVATGDILVFVNDDMRMLSPDWDDRIRGQLARPSVGALGAKLLYPQGTIQHAGIIAGWPGGMVHDGLDRDQSECGPEFRYAVTRRVAAVTGAFLAVKRKHFDALGGFDAIRFAVAYNDVDFCFRLREAGLAVLWTPHIVLTHFESKTRNSSDANAERLTRQQAELRAMQSLWGDAMDRDPAVNPFWFAYGRPLRLVWPPSLDVIGSFITNTGQFRDPYRIVRKRP